MGFSLTLQLGGANSELEISLNFCMDYYSILDNSPSQAGPEPVPPNLVSSNLVSSDPALPNHAATVAVVHQALRFPAKMEASP